MAVSERIKHASQNLETAHAIADTLACALFEASGDPSFHNESNPPAWVALFRNTVDDLLKVGGELVEAINGAREK